MSRLHEAGRKNYAIVERATGYAGGAIVYLDDRAENVQGGLARGWRTILHETPEKTIRRCAKWDCRSTLTLKDHRQFRVANGKDPFGEIVQRQARRLKLF